VPQKPQKTEDPRRSGLGGRRPKWLVFALAGAIVLVAVILVGVSLHGGADDANDLASDATDSGATEVTSPYDFTELPAGTGPSDVADASYVSVLLVNKSGQLTSYGLSAEVAAAQALKEAVRQAEQVDGDILSSLTTVTQAASAGTDGLRPTLTFVFPDRTTLTFAAYVEQGLIVRDERAWRVEGDLAMLIEAAATAGGQ
jgi:hypothetical protein